MFSQDLFLKFFRFGLVGFAGMAVDFLITYIFKEKLKVYKLIANAFGFAFGASTTYILNRSFTFHNTNPEIFTQYFKFIVVSFIGLCLNTLIVYLLTEKYKWNFYLSKLGAVLVVVFWNFFANYYYTFRI